MSLYHASSRIGVGNRVTISCCRLRYIQLTRPKNTEHGIFPRRASSTSSSSSFDDKSFAPRLNQSDFEREWKLLYHRNPSRNTSPRAFFGISTFNLLYWAWYVFDFTPAINSAAQTKFELGKIDPETLQMLLIDTNIGYIGMCVSSVIWLGAFSYSRQLVSAIWATQPPEDEEVDCRLAVATLKLPFLTQPTILLKTVYDPESNNFDGSVEDIRFTDSDIISTPSVEIFAPGDLALCEDKIQHDAIVKYDGDFRRLRGHIALKKTSDNTEKNGPIVELFKHKFLVDIGLAEEVMPNASSTLRYHLFSRDYRLSKLKRKVHNGTKKSGNADSSAMTSDRGRRRLGNSDIQRPVSQLEIARGILNDSMRRKPGK